MTLWYASVARWLPCTLGTVLLMILLPVVLDGVLHPVCWPEPFIAVVTAIGVVAWAFWSTPRHGQWVAVVWWLLGSGLASIVWELDTYPECHPLAYQSMSWPWPLAVAAGAVTWMAGMWLSRRH